MNVSGSPLPKKTTLFSSRQNSPAIHSPAKQGKVTTTTNSRGRCRGLNDCITMASAMSRPHHHGQSNHTLEHQVEELEKEIEKQKELRAMYRKRMERTQDYLRYCLTVAQENGLLDVMINYKRDQQQDYNSPLSSHQFVLATTLNPPTPPPSALHPDLAAIVDQAQTNGWYIEPHEIELHEKVGHGSTADVYRGTWRGLDVAVKCIYPNFFLSNEGGVSFFAQEVQTLSRQRHQFVLQLMAASLRPPDHGWVVTELMSMTLKHWLHGPGENRRTKARAIPLPPLEERVGKAVEIAQAMQYLHQQTPKLIHRDLKPSNIFLDDAMHVRVADFGHARFLSDGQKALTGETGTYVYMAPEVIRCEPYSEKCDVYSFGIILNELITGSHPYVETDYPASRIAMEVADGKLRPALPECETTVMAHPLAVLIDLVETCWEEDAATRPSFKTITPRMKKIQQQLTHAII